MAGAARRLRLRPSPPRPQEDGTGYFTIETYPWTNVTVDGRSLGVTPIVRAPLSAGAHSVKFENVEQGVSQTQSITIVAGETLSKRIGLR